MSWASSYVGIPWRDRGRGRDGADCWGLMRLVYRDQAGIDLPDYGTAYSSAASAREVRDLVAQTAASSDWRGVDRHQPFDVLVFREGRSDRHVGVALGDGRMLHMARGDCAKVERLDEPFWQPRFVGAHRHRLLDGTEPQATLPVTLMPVAGEHRDAMTVAAGMTVAEIVGAALPGLPPAALHRVSVTLVTAAGAMPVPHRHWRQVRPKSGVQVLVRLVPGQNQLRSVLSILVSVAAIALGQFWLGPWVATTFGITEGLAAAIVGASVSLVGNFLINTFLPAQSADQKKEKPVYAISTWRNEARPDGAVPLILGKHRVAPPFAASTWTEIVGDAMYLRALFCVGYGPLALSELKIGETPIGEYDECEVEVREGYADDETLTLYSQQTIEVPEGGELTRPRPRDEAGEVISGPAVETPVLRVSASDASEIGVIIGFPGGLIRFDNKNRERSATVAIRIRQRPVGSADPMTEVATLNISGRRREAIYRQFWWTPPGRGRWEYDVTRMTPESTDAQVSDRSVLVATQSRRPEYPINFDKPLALVAIRVRATHQLNGTLDRFNLVASSIAPDWDAETESWIERETRNPAALYRRMLQGPAARYPEPDAGIDLAQLADWSAFCSPKALNYDRVHDFEGEWLEQLAAVAAAGRASPRHDGRRWGVVIDRPGGTVVDHVNPLNSRGFRWRHPYFDPPHAYRVPFIDASNGFQGGEMLVPWPGHEGEITVTEERPLPGKVDPTEIWIETRRAQYAAIHRPGVVTAIQDGAARVATRGDLVMGSWDTLDSTMAVARVVAVRDRHVELDGPVTMEADESYRLRWRVFADNDTIGESIVRPVMTVAGEHWGVTFLGDGDLPAAGVIVHFGRAARDSLPLIVAGIEPADGMASMLTMQPHVPLIDELTDAEVPPPWDGRVGFIADPDETPPGVPVFTSITTGAAGTDDPGGLSVSLRAGTGTAVDFFTVSHRLVGAPTWSTVQVPAAAGGAPIPGYATDDQVELQAIATSIAGIPGPATAIVTVIVGSGDQPLPDALPPGAVTTVGNLGHARITIAVPAGNSAVAASIWRTTGAVPDVEADPALATVAVTPGQPGTVYVDGDATRTNMLANGDFSSNVGWNTDPGFVIGSGILTKTAGASNSAWRTVAYTVGKTYRRAINILSLSAGSIDVRSSPASAGTISPTYTTPGLKLSSFVAQPSNATFLIRALSTSTAGTFDDVAQFEETATCAPQGVQSYWVLLFNDDGQPGALAGPFTATII